MVHKSTLVAPVFIALFVAALSGCAHTPPAPPGTAQWNYPENPNWGEDCQRIGMPQQSPVNLAATTPTPWPATATVRQTAFVEHDQNVVLAPAITIVPAVGSSAAETYLAAGFHFHAPNEHVVPGRPQIEIHIKTSYGTGRTAVFAVLWEADADAAADPFLTAALRSIHTPATAVDVTPIFREFARLPFYSYEGSLTTPPCSTNIRWYVIQQPFKTSQESIRQLVNALVAEGKPVDNRRQPRPLSTSEVYLVRPN